MGIVLDSQYIERQVKGSLILSNDFENFDLLMKKIKKEKTSSKFILIVNGGCAEKIFNFIKKNNYNNYLFQNGIIYTTNLEKYENIKKKYPDFFKIICVNRNQIVKYLKETFEKIKNNNVNYYINSIINNITYKEVYYPLHKELSKFYGDETENSFTLNYKIFSDFLENEKEISYGIKESILRPCQLYKELNKKNYEKIIINYLKDEIFSKSLNFLLKQKDISIYEKIGYFVSNIIYSFVEYGKKTEIGVNYSMSFYSGTTLNIVEILELLKNRGLIIAFPYFLSLVNKKDFAEKVSERKLSKKEKKKKEFYSVIMKINYLFEKEYEPSVFNLKNLSDSKEEEFILLPFTFLKLKSIKIDSSNYIADLELDILGKKEILENKIKESKTIEFDSTQNIVFSK